MHPFYKSILCNPLIVQVTKDFIFQGPVPLS